MRVQSRVNMDLFFQELGRAVYHILVDSPDPIQKATVTKILDEFNVEVVRAP